MDDRRLLALYDAQVRGTLGLRVPPTWTVDHDRADLVPLLLERGARAEPHEALVLGETRLLAAEPVLPEGLTMRRVTERADLEVLAVEDGDTVVSAAWLVPLGGTEVAGLWGGSTLAAYRGRGIYRALVAARATSALARGCTVLQVDASDDSRPILERLGLRTVGGTTPYAVRLSTSG